MSTAQDFVQFLTNASGSPFNATAVLRDMLLGAGFTELREDVPWKLAKGGRFFFTRNAASVFAFAVGGAYELGNGFSIAGAHVDSPALKLKPPSSALDAHGSLILGTECYGGGIWQTWFDRDLGICGKAVVLEKDGSYTSRAVSIRRALARVSTIAPHLDQPYADGFKLNKETELRAVIGSQNMALNAGPHGLAATLSVCEGAKAKHHPAVIRAVAKELGVDPCAIAGVDLRLCDTQPAAIAGVDGEFVVGQGIDNLNGSFCATRAFIESCACDLAAEPNVRVITLFDHEECGSQSPQGAASPVLSMILERVITGLVAGGAVKVPADAAANPGFLAEQVAIARRKSFVLSIDNAHAVHPNYPGKHELQQPPRMNRGPVVKHNCNQRYATDAEGCLILQLLAAKAGVPMQEFVIRQDSACGTTIGPTTGSLNGIRTVDLGNAQLSMHSIREVCGAEDIGHMIGLVRSFFLNFPTLKVPL